MASRELSICASHGQVRMYYGSGTAAYVPGRQCVCTRLMAALFCMK